MNVLLSVQQNLAVDDPQTTFVLQACTRICQCLGEAFLPYMNFVLPPLLESAQLDAGFSVQSK